MLTPQARALLERARRPLTMFAIGVGLAGPASAFMLREDAARAANGTAGETAASSAGMIDAKELASANMTLGLARAYNVPVALAVQIHKVAESEGIAPRLAFGLVRTESEFKRTAVSPVGAVGFTQVMPGTAKWMKPGTSRSDLFDPQTNLQVGFRYLKGLIDRYDGDVRLALTAYNRGPGVVDKLVKGGRDPENGYATKVLADPAKVRLTPEQAQVAALAASSTAVPAVRAAAPKHATRHSAHRSTRRHRVAAHHAHPARRHHARGRRRHR